MRRIPQSTFRSKPGPLRELLVYREKPSADNRIPPPSRPAYYLQPMRATPQPTRPQGESGQSPFDRMTLVFWVAFLVRVAYLTMAHTYRIRPFPDHFEYGWEMGRIARALATGCGYADPFAGHTGPTAWVTPLYPLLIACRFQAHGHLHADFSVDSADPELAFQCADCLSRWRRSPGAALPPPGRHAQPAFCRWAVWLWALYPAAMQYAVRWVWETSLSTLLFTCAFALALRMRQRSSGPGQDVSRCAIGCFSGSFGAQLRWRTPLWCSFCRLPGSGF